MVDTTFSVKVLIVQEYQFREQHRLFITFLTLSLHVNLKECDRSHLTEYVSSKTECHGDEWIITSATSYGVELHFNTLKSLLEVTLYFLHSVINGFVCTVLCRFFDLENIEILC